MRYRVVFTPEAMAQVEALYRYVAQAAGPDIASRYTNAIITYCEGLHTFPLRGMRRDDIRPGLRITNYKKRAVIAFAVEAEVVSVIGVYYGGQDYASVLRWEQDDL
ncbi:type II toxin-antitoxin system RelE/ParE family toxin [Rhodoferax sp.]|uniref:type II toxin-antitoxin system RelE/ParE family toxin n=1 Tax=Rhodoferax sp. TaxID=50421 RepID=UPI0025FD51FF|nr:type II toxin-antitoxin system RelE/ParE family toxin [Rhodoferax sp.]MCM2341485.1 type II toxin-antitoxin system RelE/ParE family toxin [Rhodoferax sp.]